MSWIIKSFKLRLLAAEKEIKFIKKVTRRNQLGLSQESNFRIYINDSLTKRNRSLLKLARDKPSEHFNYI